MAHAMVEKRQFPVSPTSRLPPGAVLADLSPDFLHQGKHLRVVFFELSSNKWIEVVHTQIRFRHFCEVLFVITECIVTNILPCIQQHLVVNTLVSRFFEYLNDFGLST